MNATPSSTSHVNSKAASDGIAVSTFSSGDNHPSLPPSDAGDRIPSAGIASPRHEEQSRVDPDRQTGSAGERALVLGGGGSAGNAWFIGVIAGLLDGGIDVTAADLTVGTSAGATAAAQLTGASPVELFDAIITAAPPTGSGPTGPSGGLAPAAVAEHMERTGRIMATASDPADMRRKMGAAAIDLADASGDSGSSRWRAMVAARLPGLRWPERTILITAVNAATGEPVVFDRESGVDLIDAVAASTSSGAAYSIGEGRYIDGGYRRNENADLAAGYRRVLVLSPLGGRTRTPLEWGMQLAVQADELRAQGSRVEVILPDERSLFASESNMMDLTARPPSAQAGYDQGKALSGQLGEFWR